MGRPQATPSVCAFHFPREINSYLFLKHMKYYYSMLKIIKNIPSVYDITKKNNKNNKLESFKITW